jgi:hypothetical protein
MNQGNTIVGLATAAAAVLMIFLAWLIKYKKQVNIISGYDENLYKDKDGLANHVGGTLIITGIADLLFAIAILFLPAFIGLFVCLYIAVTLTGTLTTAIGSKKYRN